MKNLFKKQSAKFVQNPSSFTKVMAKHILVCFFMPHSVQFPASAATACRPGFSQPQRRLSLMTCWLLELTEPTSQPGTALATVSAWLPRSSTHQMHFRCWPSSYRLHWPQPSLCCCWRDQQRSRLLSKDFWYRYRGISRSRYYRSRGITVRQILYLRYYRKILPITAVITTVTEIPITVTFSNEHCNQGSEYYLENMFKIHTEICDFSGNMVTSGSQQLAGSPQTWKCRGIWDMVREFLWYVTWFMTYRWVNLCM